MDDVLHHRDYLEWEKMFTCIYNVTLVSKEEELMYTEGSYKKNTKETKRNIFKFRKGKWQKFKLVMLSKERQENYDKFEETFKITKER